MFRPRVIPVLLVQNASLVKTRQFDCPRYIGDPINTVKIFSEMQADELVILDVLASQARRAISVEFVKSVGAEADMPLAVGGGIRTLHHIRDVLAAGAEKVVIGSYAAENPSFVREASTEFGASTIVVCVDVKRTLLGAEKVWTRRGSKPTDYAPVEFAQMMEEAGAGEILVQSIDRDGTMYGYDLDLVRRIAMAVQIPVIALGGAGALRDLREACTIGRASAVAASSMFVFHGPLRGVLINYPQRSQLSF